MTEAAKKQRVWRQRLRRRKDHNDLRIECPLFSGSVSIRDKGLGIIRSKGMVICCLTTYRGFDVSHQRSMVARWQPDQWFKSTALINKKERKMTEESKKAQITWCFERRNEPWSKCLVIFAFPLSYLYSDVFFCCWRWRITLHVSVSVSNQYQ
jgi:hypothetical protein